MEYKEQIFKWKREKEGGFHITIPVKTNHGNGEYYIWAQKRPIYCDRGDWLISVSAAGASDLDWSDGFPRYFFGSEDEVIEQMERWILRRKETVRDGL